MSAYIPEPHFPAIEHLNGVPWHKESKRHSKLRKRLPHRHVAQTRGQLRSGLYVERCWCGAYGPRPWLRRV